MSYSDQSQFPKGRRFFSGVSSTPQTVFTVAEGRRKIAWIAIVGGAAARTVTFRAIDDTPIFTSARVAANTTMILAGWESVADEGMAVLTDSATADVAVTVFEFQA